MKHSPHTKDLTGSGTGRHGQHRRFFDSGSRRRVRGGMAHGQPGSGRLPRPQRRRPRPSRGWRRTGGRETVPHAIPKASPVYTTQIVHLDRHRIFDVIEGRSRHVVDDWLEDRGVEWCERIRLATLDPSAGYRSALQERLSNATLVVDHFHAIRLANQAIDQVRRRVQNVTLGHRGRKGDPLYRIRRALLTGHKRLTPNGSSGCARCWRQATPTGKSQPPSSTRSSFGACSPPEMRLTPAAA
ncbi:MAG: hypothetical protein GEU79_19475 [Acidimicrobiia bacterium]|nr:hypothetical protein [Acidimicrobiia bacterium]